VGGERRSGGSGRHREAHGGVVRAPESKHRSQEGKQAALGQAEQRVDVSGACCSTRWVWEMPAVHSSTCQRCKRKLSKRGTSWGCLGAIRLAGPPRKTALPAGGRRRWWEVAGPSRGLRAAAPSSAAAGFAPVTAPPAPVPATHRPRAGSSSISPGSGSRSWSPRWC